jgi:hypothetical protein
MTTLRIAASTLLALALASCSSLSVLPKPDGAVAGPFYVPKNVKAVSQIPANVRRVIVLPVAGGPELTEETLLKLDAVCQTELNRTAKFEVVPLSRDKLAELTGSRQISSVDKIPVVLIDKLFNIYNSYGAEAVLFIDATTYSAYPPLVLGLRTKLARVTDGEIIWAADNVAVGHAGKLGAES